MTQMIRLKRRRTPIILALALASSTCAAETHSVMANISGSITQPGCKFNLGHSLDVKFTDVDVSKIATGQYRVPVELKVSCGTVVTSITLTLIGVSGYNPDVIATDIEGLGIKLISERLGTAWRANTSISTSTKNNNNIVAILTALPGTKFQGGNFSSSVKISASYD